MKAKVGVELPRACCPNHASADTQRPSSTAAWRIRPKRSKFMALTPFPRLLRLGTSALRRLGNMSSTCAGIRIASAMIFASTLAAICEEARELPVSDLGSEPRSFAVQADESGRFTWWLPAPADALVLPISAGTLVETSNESQMRWLREGSPWDLSKLPVLGARKL